MFLNELLEKFNKKRSTHDLDYKFRPRIGTFYSGAGEHRDKVSHMNRQSIPIQMFILKMVVD